MFAPEDALRSLFRRLVLATLSPIQSCFLLCLGTIILWNLPDIKLAGVTRDTAFGMAVSLWVTLLILGGAIIHEHIDGAQAAVLLIGLNGIW